LNIEKSPLVDIGYQLLRKLHSHLAACC